jgi:O-methyltransferase
MDNVFLCEYLGTPPRSNKAIDLLDRVFRKLVPWLRIGSYWRGDMASVESRMNIFHLLIQVIIQGIEGEVVEIGCNAGESTVILQHIIQSIDPSRKLHVFDSFQGAPVSEAVDEGVYKKGDMAATQVLFMENFERLNLKRPIIHAGWFEETLPVFLPEQIAFALLDADLYRSTLIALQALYPRLSRGGICLLGVYWDPVVKVGMTTDERYKSPGVKKACDEFFTDKPERISILLAGNYTSGFFRKE